MTAPTSTSSARPRRGLLAAAAGLGSLALAAGAIYLLTRDEPREPEPSAPQQAPAAAISPESAGSPAPEPTALPPHFLAPLGQPLHRPGVASLRPPIEEIRAREITRSFLAQRRGHVQKCFDHFGKNEPRSDLAVSIQLTPPNDIASVHVSGKLNNKPLEHCITSAMQTLSVPSVAHRMAIVLPFSLSPMPREGALLRASRH